MTTNGSKLESIFAYQEHMVKTLGETKIFGENRQVNSPEFLHLSFELIREVTEMVQSSLDENTPWKPHVGGEALKQEAFEELIDCMFYVVELFIFLGKTPDDVYEAYMDKWRRNMRRVQDAPSPD